MTNSSACPPSGDLGALPTNDAMRMCAEPPKFAAPGPRSPFAPRCSAAKAMATLEATTTTTDGFPTLSADAALTIAAALLNGTTDYRLFLITQFEKTIASRQPPATNQHTNLEPGNTTQRPERETRSVLHINQRTTEQT